MSLDNKKAKLEKFLRFYMFESVKDLATKNNKSIIDSPEVAQIVNIKQLHDAITRKTEYTEKFDEFLENENIEEVIEMLYSYMSVNSLTTSSIIDVFIKEYKILLKSNKHLTRYRLQIDTNILLRLKNFINENLNVNITAKDMKEIYSQLDFTETLNLTYYPQNLRFERENEEINDFKKEIKTEKYKFILDIK